MNWLRRIIIEEINNIVPEPKGWWEQQNEEERRQKYRSQLSFQRDNHLDKYPYRTLLPDDYLYHFTYKSLLQKIRKEGLAAGTYFVTKEGSKRWRSWVGVEAGCRTGKSNQSCDVVIMRIKLGDKKYEIDKCGTRDTNVSYMSRYVSDEEAPKALCVTILEPILPNEIKYHIYKGSHKDPEDISGDAYDKETFLQETSGELSFMSNDKIEFTKDYFIDNRFIPRGTRGIVIGVIRNDEVIIRVPVYGLTTVYLSDYDPNAFPLRKIAL